MLSQLIAIARNAFLESIRQPIYFVLILAGAVLQAFNVAITAYSMDYSDNNLEVDADDQLLLQVGLATVLMLSTLLAAFVATNVMSREIENKTALTVISKPVSRPMFVLGKYLGVTAAIVVAAVIMLIEMQLAVRHGVLSTVRDKPDGPVLIFGIGALLLSVGAGAWANFFYNRVFASTAIIALIPLSVIAWVAVMFTSKEWALQPTWPDFLPQITIASGCVLLAIIVITSLALAASTRLGQVMTIATCGGVLFIGLLSNHFLGTRAFQNTPIAQVIEVEWPDTLEGLEQDLAQPGATANLYLFSDPDDDLVPGKPLYYGPAPTGLALAVPSQNEIYTGNPANPDDTFRWAGDPALVVQSYDAERRVVTVVNAGGLNVARSPLDNLTEAEREQRLGAGPRTPTEFGEGWGRPNLRVIDLVAKGDYLFTEPTQVNAGALAAWSVIPNLQLFWLTDAILQGHEITGKYVMLLIAYSSMQVLVFLSVAIALFQTRDMG